MLPTDIFLSFNVGELTKYLLRMSLSIVLLERYNSMMMMRERESRASSKHGSEFASHGSIFPPRAFK